MGKLLLATFLSAASAPSFADYMCWMIDDDSYSSYWEDKTPFAYAMIKVDGTAGTYLTLAFDDGREFAGTAVGPAGDGATGLSTDLCWAQIDPIHMKPETSFVLELYNENDDLVGHSLSAVSYGQLEKGEFIHRTLPDPDAPYAPFVAWNAIPEPTSGLLTLFGMALLALKRKRAR